MLEKLFGRNRRRQGQDKAERAFNQMVRITGIEDDDGAMWEIRREAAELVGSRLTLGEAVGSIARKFVGTQFVALPRCECGLAHCLSNDHPVIGYVDDEAAEWNPEGFVIRRLLSFDYA